MKVVLVSEERLDLLVQQCLSNIFRSPDATKMEEKVDHGTVNYHLCVFKDALKTGGL